MKKTTIATIAAILLVIAAMAYLLTGCDVEWTRPGSQLTLEQRGVLVRVAARRAIIEAYREEPGPWNEYVCSVATIIQNALDGDSKAIADCPPAGGRIAALQPIRRAANQLSTDNTMTIETKDLLLGLLTYTEENWDLKGWEGAIADAIELFNAFVLTGVTTEHDVWFLTREFFAGISEGCVVIRQELH